MAQTDAIHSYSRKGRSWATLIAVLIAWTLIIVAWASFDAALWLVGLFAVATLPAIWDFYAARMAGATLTHTHLSWFSGRRSSEVALPEIDHVRLVTRLDMTVRAAVVLKSGQKLRLPAEATPPATAFEQALTDAGIRSERHHFTFL